MFPGMCKAESCLSSLQPTGVSQREFAHCKMWSRLKKEIKEKETKICAKQIYPMFEILWCCLGCFMSVFWPFASVSVTLYASSPQEHITFKSDEDCPWFMIQIVHYYFL